MKPTEAFTWIPTKMLADTSVSMSAKGVWMALLSYANEEGECYPAIARIAERAGCPVRTVQRSLPLLVKAGWLEVKSKVGRMPTHYKVMQVPTAKMTTAKLATAKMAVVPEQSTTDVDEKGSTATAKMALETQAVTAKMAVDYRQNGVLSISNYLDKDLKDKEREKERETPKALFSEPPDSVPTPKRRAKTKNTMTEDVAEVLQYLNTTAGTKYRSGGNIAARLAEGYTVADCKKVIDKKVDEWLATKMEPYLNPVTLFRPSHFDTYLNQPPPAFHLPRFTEYAEKGRAYRPKYDCEVQQNKRPAPVMDISNFVKGEDD